MTIIDGKKVAAEIREQILAEAQRLPRRPGLAMIFVGRDPASQVYVRNKRKDCEKCGIESIEYNYDESITEEELIGIIDDLNQDDRVDGILIQLPLPAGINEDRVLERICPEKDVDAFHPENIGKMITGKPVLWPCTPTGIMELFHYYNISLEGKVCVMVGRSGIVGKPMGLLMLRENGTVIYCHSKTPDLETFTRQADILVIAAGCPNLIRGDMVKEGVVLIDVAMNMNPETGKFTGDVVFDEVAEKASYIPPVPGGVGPMTRAILLRNILQASKNHQGFVIGEDVPGEGISEEGISGGSL